MYKYYIAFDNKHTTEWWAYKVSPEDRVWQLAHSKYSLPFNKKWESSSASASNLRGDRAPHWLIVPVEVTKKDMEAFFFLQKLFQ